MKLEELIQTPKFKKALKEEMVKVKASAEEFKKQKLRRKFMALAVDYKTECQIREWKDKERNDGNYSSHSDLFDKFFEETYKAFKK